MSRRRHERWGGSWTEQKLAALEKYIRAYLRIMHRNERASRFTKIYLDGFAGSGKRYAREIAESAQQELELIPEVSTEVEREELREYMEGSALRVLRVEEPAPFDRYIFIDIDPKETQKLQQQLSTQFPNRNIEIVTQDANTYIQNWCSQMGAFDRAVVFLDPFGLQVEWKTIQAIAETGKIDCWLLIPLGVGLLRMLPRNKMVSEQNQQTLTRFFGTEEWKERFYQRTEALALPFDEDEFREDEYYRVDKSQVAQFIIERLRSVFPHEGVIEEPLVLRHSKNNPIYLFAFAAGNRRGARTAVKIARDIIGRSQQ
jgi:three-Cys-motif partner protein